MLLLGFSLPAKGQDGELNATFDFQAAADDNPQVGEVGSFRPTLDQFTTNFVVSPTLVADIKGAHHTGQLFYSLGVNRFPSESDLNYESHQFGGSLDSQLSNKLRLTLSEQFIKSPDFQQATLLQGISVTPEGLFFDFENVLLREKSYANIAVVETGYQLSPASELSAGVRHRLRRFSAPRESIRFSDQDSVYAHLQFRKDIEKETSWDLRYTFSQHQFQDFEDAGGHSVSLGLSHQMSPHVSLRLGAGPSIGTSTNGQRVEGYNAEFRIAYAREEDGVSLSYYRDNGATTGLGSISQTHGISVNFHKALWRNAILRAGLLAHESTPLFDNPVETQGYSANLVLALPLKGGWSFRVGGSHANQQGTQTYEFDRTRVFVGFRYDLPGFLRF